MTSNAKSQEAELLPCPFCGKNASIRSNNDWHRLEVDHDENCVFSDPETMVVPATEDQFLLIVSDWNRRAAPPEPASGGEAVATWRNHDAAIDSKALSVATEISLMWGRDRSQFVSRIQVAVTEAMRWVYTGQPSQEDARDAGLDRALCHLSNALDDLESSPDQRPVLLIREAMHEVRASMAASEPKA